MKITITAEVADDLVDQDDDTGLTGEAHGALMDALMSEGLDDITIRKGSA